MRYIYRFCKYFPSNAYITAKLYSSRDSDGALWIRNTAIHRGAYVTEVRLRMISGSTGGAGESEYTTAQKGATWVLWICI